MAKTDVVGKALGTPTKVAILRLLFSLDGGSFTGRHLSRLAGVSQKSGSNALADLCGAGIVSFRVLGSGNLYSLNTAHRMFPALAAMFGKEGSELEEAAAFLARRLGGLREAKVLGASIFGSLARGEAEPSSDLDLFVTAGSERDKAAVERLLDAIGLPGGRHLHHSVRTLSEAKGLLDSGKALPREVIRDEKPVYGRSLADLLGVMKRYGDRASSSIEDKGGRR